MEANMTCQASAMVKQQEERKEEASPQCIICLEAWASLEPQTVTLLPCKHSLCENCFMIFHQKNRNVKCAVCKQTITHYQVCNSAALTQSDKFDFQELLEKNGDVGKPIDDHGSAFDCLDHSYFVAEISKLIQLRNEIELDRFHRRISNQDPTRQKNLDLQWNAIKQIELRLLDLQDQLLALELFDATMMVKEVHEMTETLIKIKAGTLSSLEIDALNQDNHVFQQASAYNNRFDDDYYGDELYGDEYGDEDEGNYGIENHRFIQKTLSKKCGSKKVTNKQISNVITAQVKRKC